MPLRTEQEIYLRESVEIFPNLHKKLAGEYSFMEIYIALNKANKIKDASETLGMTENKLRGLITKYFYDLSPAQLRDYTPSTIKKLEKILEKNLAEIKQKKTGAISEFNDLHSYLLSSNDAYDVKFENVLNLKMQGLLSSERAMFIVDKIGNFKKSSAELFQMLTLNLMQRNAIKILNEVFALKLPQFDKFSRKEVTALEKQSLSLLESIEEKFINLTLLEIHAAIENKNVIDFFAERQSSYALFRKFLNKYFDNVTPGDFKIMKLSELEENAKQKIEQQKKVSVSKKRPASDVADDNDNPRKEQKIQSPRSPQSPMLFRSSANITFPEPSAPESLDMNKLDQIFDEYDSYYFGFGN